MHADKLYYDERLHQTAQFLTGNVKFNHEGTLMYCDSALFYEATNSFDAFGNVRMVQGDTLTLTSEVLYYNGIDRLARARFNVVLKHLKTTLYTDSLDYDRIYDLGYFFEGGRLLDQGNELTSDWGQYQPATHQAIFNYNVRLVNPEPPEPPKTVLVSDTLYYIPIRPLHMWSVRPMSRTEKATYTQNAAIITPRQTSLICLTEVFW
jgi:hypothetical protein